jgi:hypothetical protein
MTFWSYQADTFRPGLEGGRENPYAKRRKTIVRYIYRTFYEFWLKSGIIL